MENRTPYRVPGQKGTFFSPRRSSTRPLLGGLPFNTHLPGFQHTVNFFYSIGRLMQALWRVL